MLSRALIPAGRPRGPRPKPGRVHHRHLKTRSTTRPMPGQFPSRTLRLLTALEVFEYLVAGGTLRSLGDCQATHGRVPACRREEQSHRKSCVALASWSVMVAVESKKIDTKVSARPINQADNSLFVRNWLGEAP